MDSVNAHDLAGMEREMHFPHARIATGTIATYAAPGSNPLDLFERLQRETTPTVTQTSTVPQAG